MCYIVFHSMITREPIIFEPTRAFFRRIGQGFISAMFETGRATMIALAAFANLRYAFTARARREITVQMYSGGIKSLGVVSIVALFIGMIMAVQLGTELRRWNQEELIGPAVMLTMLREMGPFMTGLILAACVGSAMAAQLGTMTINEEIAALEIMSIDPVRFLVMPRMVSMMILLPLLSFYTSILGVFGGGIVGNLQLSVPWRTYIQLSLDFASSKALFVGLFKAYIFGILITTIACYEGFTCDRGAVGVGTATRRCVISCFLLILVTGYFVTRMFYS